jgi:hypothetical protein
MSPSPKLLVESGQRFNRWTLLEETWLAGGRRGAVCQCDCGHQVATRIDHLVSGRTRSCGCLCRERASEASTTHGLKKHPLYVTWNGMIQRCHNKRATSYKDYGGRGITVCSRWHDVSAFIEDIERLVGPRPAGMTLDRVRPGLGYKPSNVRWADASTQRLNRHERSAA